MKRLRERRGLTRDVLAGKVGITGVTIAGTETLIRRPSVPMLEKLALALGVPDLLAKTLKEAGERPIRGTNRVTVADFRFRELFPPTAPLSIPVLRLMAASNDAGHLQRLMLASMEHEPVNRAKELVQNGEKGYLYRRAQARTDRGAPGGLARAGEQGEVGWAPRSADADGRFAGPVGRFAGIPRTRDGRGCPDRNVPLMRRNSALSHD